MEILNRSPLHRACNRGTHASVAFFSSRDVCAERFVSLQERASRALFSRHARHLLPQVTGVLSDQFVLGGEVDFSFSSEVAIRDDQSLVCPQRVLGRVLELVLRRSLLRFPPSGRGRKHGMAVQWAGRRSRRIRTGPAGCRRGGDHRCSARCVADGSRHSFAGLPGSTLKSGSTFKYRIVGPRACVWRQVVRRSRASPGR